jgi:hypothetical protein
MGVELDVYGLRVSVDGDWEEIVEDVGRDFEWFRQLADFGPADVTVKVERRPPDPGPYAELPQAFITSRNAVFQNAHETVIDYFGRALAVYDRARDELRVQGEEAHLVHEAAYLFLLSRIGRHLDRSALTRIHALGLGGRQGAVLVLLPSGGGKSTLALRALRDPSIKLLSEDTPVLDRRGHVHPFPLRIGINEHDQRLIPEGAQVRRIERLEYGPKLLLSLGSFTNKIEPVPQPLGHVVIGARTLSKSGRLAPLPRRTLAGPLFRDAVVGVGVAQMVEYVLQSGARDVLKQGRVASSRAYNCAAALKRASAWRLELGRDPEQNFAELQRLL